MCFCDRIFPFNSKLDKHIKKVHSLNTNYQYKTVQKTEPKMIKCKNCEDCFTEKKYLRKHHYENHIEKSNTKCDICEKVFKNSLVLQMHYYQIHQQNQKTHKCDKCSRLFQFKYNLKIHWNTCGIIASRKREILFNCDKCNKSFYKKNTLEIHSWNCGKTNEAKCQICDKIFKSPSVLQIHFNLYHREKRFKCESCSETFAVRSLLQNHKETSTQCNVENQMYKNSKGAKEFKNYEELVSGKGTNFKCKKCDAYYKTLSSFYAHYSRSHKEKTNQCNNCGKYFSFLSHLKTHLKSCVSLSKESINPNKEITGQKLQVNSMESSNNQECIKTSKHEKDISKCKLQLSAELCLICPFILVKHPF